MMDWRSLWVVRWFNENVTQPLVAVMQRGAEPKALALSGAVGVTLGIFPIYGVTALLCGVVIGLLGARCNAPTVLIANVIATPLEWSLVVPFLRLGETVVGGRHLLLSKDALWKAVTFQASWDVILGILHALLGWGIAAPVIIGCLYFMLLPVMRYSVNRYGPQQTDNDLSPLLKDSAVCDA